MIALRGTITNIFDIMSVKIMRVYLDNCCYNRPFDPSVQTRVQVETICKLAVQFMMATRKVEYVWSEMLDYEVSQNPSLKRQMAILRWVSGAVENVALDDVVYARAAELEKSGIKTKDAIHLASAEQSECDWLLTTDDRFIRRAQGNTEVRVATPVEFIMENKDENV